MQRKVKFYPRRVAEAITIPHHIISIGEPDHLAKLHENHNVLQLSFHDIPGHIPGLVQFGYTDAVRIIEFLESLPHDHTRVIVHCEAGISRSAAVAQFMIRDMGYVLEPDQFCKGDFSGANPRVYGMLRTVYFSHKRKQQ